ncbi:MAG: proline--tRNA ligase [Candidatus Kapabacteria bacterium]|nr:proline--tRNA ligase [Candidatus Kapabacteria bacterium]
MRQSEYFIPTLKEIPADAQIPSHQLLLRAGMVRQLASGIFSFLPLGFKVLNKVIGIIREEMNRIGGQEFLLPALNPIEIWEQTGRVESMGDVMFHIKNREGLVLAPTHEEIITVHARQHIKSYRDMPQIWYQIQTKFRNEPRPKSGILRGRQFIMKDAYSLDTTFEGLDESYNKHAKAYKAIFDRCGIQFFVVGASSGAMGGRQSQEFMVESDSGEDTCAVADSGYAANIEVAVSGIPPVGRINDNLPLELFPTPSAKTINDLINQYGFPEERCAKSVLYIADDEPVLLFMRGNDELNETKLQSILGTANIRPAVTDELIKYSGADHGSIGPINLKTKVRIIADSLLKDANGLISGANQNGYHYKNIDFTRDCTIPEYQDLRTVQAGEPCIINGSPIRVVKAIELGHIFKLGTKYSEALGANFIDSESNEHPIIMGSYGIGAERVLACYIEQHNDSSGIIWEGPLSPFHAHILGLNESKFPEVKQIAEKIYLDLSEAGYELLYDDRNESPGIKFNDADLIGIPIQIIVGNKNLVNGKVEIKSRKDGIRQLVDFTDIVSVLKGIYA